MMGQVAMFAGGLGTLRVSIMKVSGEILEASDQRLTEEGNRNDQDGEKKNGKNGGCKTGLDHRVASAVWYAG